MTPLWGIPLGQGLKHSNLLLITLSAVLLLVTIWTFFGKSQRYVDSTTGKVVNEKSWLWFKWGDESSLSQYKYLAVVDYHASSTESGSGPSSLYWEVNLVGKYSSSNNVGGFDTNFTLKSFKSEKSTQTQVMKYAHEVARELKIEVVVEANFE
jgi:hypothetical protein